MRTLLPLLLALWLGGCAAAPPRVGDGAGGTVGNQVIVGTWVWVLSDNYCSEIYRYYDNGHGLIISGEELVLFSYSIDALPNDAGRYPLHLTIEHDFGGMDCAEDDSDSSGQKLTGYLQFFDDNNSYAHMLHPIERRGFGPFRRVTH